MKEFAVVIACLVSAVLAIPTIALSKEKYDAKQHNCASCHSMTVKEANELISKIGGNVKSVKQAPAKGMYEVFVEKDGRQGIIFVDYAKKHLVQGLVISLNTMQPVAAHEDLLQKAKEPANVDVKKIPVENAFVLGNPKGTKSIYVFTDPDCPYCRTFHNELNKLATIAPDVTINVMLFPLPMHPQAYDKSRAVLESGSVEILDKAFEGKEVPKPAKEESKAKVDAIMKFAESAGINGTPTFVLPDGKIMVGGRDAESLKKLIEGAK